MGNFFCGNQQDNQIQFFDSFTPNVFISQSGRPIGYNYDRCTSHTINRYIELK